jgi:tRNA 2-thiouridine synthesizing protein A
MSDHFSDLSHLEAKSIRLDARGMHCPLPVLKAKKLLAAMGIGDHLEVLATDSDSVKDFETFTRLKGHQLLQSSSADGIYIFLIEKGHKP